ncbi:LuxR C-terminal-related transcriptional regulator [Streptomyces odonnellii]|uniref:LuxR C-terminal-related transcriptional regulator n=1 Tax=Streptomyces odonnellii TaxID=1417980 RepID=UPI00099B343C|nr:LuxR family transcriptional regulator [Streptomyces odonnellii]
MEDRSERPISPQPSVHEIRSPGSPPGEARPSSPFSPFSYSWPFTGRDGTLAELISLMEHSARPVLLITGPVGVGKTRTARELLSRTEAEAETGTAASAERLLTASATESVARIPFGALAHLLPTTLPTAGGRPNLLRVLADGLLAGIGDGQRILLVDDVHLLDDGSASLLLHLAVRSGMHGATRGSTRGGTHGGIRIVLTGRSEVPMPDAVEALIRGNYADRVELPPLGPDSVSRLLERTLRGQVQTATAHSLWQYSGGNVLWLQQLVDAGLASGTLAAVGDVWRWHGPFQLSTRLVDLVSRRIGQLSAPVQRAAELMALGEPLGVTVFEQLTGAAVMDELDRRELIVGEKDGWRSQVRLAHPLYGEVLRRRTPPHRWRRHCRDLAEAIERTGMRRREDPARVGGWRLEAGDLTDPRFLLSAAEHAVLTMDFTLAARLARAACDAGGGAPAQRALAVALGYTGDGVRAEQVHSGLSRTITPDREELQSVQLRAANMYLSLDRPADAVELLRGTEEAMTDEAACPELASLQAVLLASQADWPAYTQAVERARQCASPGPRTTVRVLYAECIDHFCHARTDTALRLIESALRILSGENDIPFLHAGLLSWLCNAQAFSGRLGEAEATATAQYEQALESKWVGSQGAWRLYLGRIAARRGQLATARRHMREAASTLRDDSTWGQHALVFGEWATVEAMAGNAAEAQTLLDQAHLAHVESYRSLHTLAFRMAQPWILAARGRLRDAARQAMRAADDARREQGLLWEAELLHLPVRLGQSAAVSGRLVELATVSDAPHIAIYAEHAGALAGRDASALEQVCASFETAGMHLHAAEAAAHAARLWLRNGSTVRAQRAADRCLQLARHCEGVMTPAVLACWTPELTDRERDIARLAADGQSSRQIASRLGIMVRTVDNHLYRVYRKTGVTNRRELRNVLTLGLSETTEATGSAETAETTETADGTNGTEAGGESGDR